MDDFEIEKAEPEPKGIRPADFWWGPLSLVWFVLVLAAIISGLSLMAGPSREPAAEIAWWCRVFGALAFAYIATKMALFMGR